LCSSGFLKKEAIIRLNGFDESFYEMEDYPFLLNVTSNGVKLHFNPVETVIYRFNDLSLSQQYYEKWVYLETKGD